MRIWLWPTIIGALSVTSLVVGLLYDGFGDVFAWIGLGLPVWLSYWYGWGRK